MALPPIVLIFLLILWPALKNSKSTTEDIQTEPVTQSPKNLSSDPSPSPFKIDSTNTEASQKKVRDNTSNTQRNGHSVIKAETVCIPYDEFVNSGLAEQVQNWYVSWGAPRFDLSGEIDQVGHIYADYSNQSLSELARNGDRDAMYALGVNKVWQAFTGEAQSPHLKWGDELMRFPNISEDYDESLLLEAREYLFSSAVLGNVYAFADLSFSFSYQRKAEELKGNSERLNEIDILALAYTQMPIKLMPEIDEFFFQGPKLTEERYRQAQLMTESLLQKFDQQRQTLGLGKFQPPLKSDYFDEFTVCDELN